LFEISFFNFRSSELGNHIFTTIKISSFLKQTMRHRKYPIVEVYYTIKYPGIPSTYVDSCAMKTRQAHAADWMSQVQPQPQPCCQPYCRYCSPGVHMKLSPAPSFYAARRSQLLHSDTFGSPTSHHSSVGLFDLDSLLQLFSSMTSHPQPCAHFDVRDFDDVRCCLSCGETVYLADIPQVPIPHDPILPILQKPRLS
jgi:hypothetical protein